MRQKKAANLKRIGLTVSLPQSIKAYIAADCDDPSFTIQRWAAERVLGAVMEEHWAIYSGMVDIRYKPEPLKKSYIRAARWILESRITRIWQHEWAVTVEAEWLLTGVKGFYLIDLMAGPGFVHVLYDHVVAGPDESHGEPVSVLALIEPILKGPSEWYKWTILKAWIRNSYRRPND